MHLTKAADDPGALVATRLATSTAAVTSSTDTGLNVSVRAITQTPTGGEPSTTLQVVVAIRSLESHQWAIPVAGSDFAYDAAAGTASFSATSTELGPYGQIDLTASPLGPPTTTECADGSSITVRDEAVQGSLDFSTGSAAWGKVSGHPIAFGGINQLVQDFGTAGDACFNPAPTGLTTCTPSIYWSTPYGSNGTISGGWKSVPHASTGQVTASRTVTVAQPGSPVAQRTDTDIRQIAIPTTTVWPTHALVGVSGKASEEVTGSAALKSNGSPSLSRRTCGATQVTSRAWKATLTPGSQPLTIEQAVGGPIAVSKNAAVAHIRLVTGANENSFG